tara:strand:- start:11 stop:289 length:279 start_codon:yes stop_codon:yes gene_type:complete
MTNEEFEPIRIRIMKEAYDLADKNDTEGYNSVKVMCSDIQNLMHRKPLTDAEIYECYRSKFNIMLTDSGAQNTIKQFARAIERAHGIGVEDE